MGVSQFDEVLPIVAGAGLGSGAGTSPVTYTTTALTAYRLDTIACLSTDTIDHDVYLYRTVGGVQTICASVHVPAGSGFTSLPAIELLPADVVGAQGGLLMPVGATLQMQVIVAVSSGKNLWLNGQGGYL